MDFAGIYFTALRGDNRVRVVCKYFSPVLLKNGMEQVLFHAIFSPFQFAFKNQLRLAV